MAYKLKCKCLEYKTRWTEQEPGHPHHYRVECQQCGRFMAWANRNSMSYHVQWHDAQVISWAEQLAKPKPTLDRFFET
jgi:hypothetical protein